MITGAMNRETARFFPNGSRWVRADFHLHTVADREFEKPAPGVPYPEAYVEALVRAQIGVGVVTNHNKFDQDEFKVLRKDALGHGILLLPGVELSVQGGATGVHLLVVFDAESWVFNRETEPWINKFLDKAFDQIPNRESENTVCQWTVRQVLDELDNSRQHGRDSFIIAAHVDRNKGILKELGGGIRTHYGKLFRQFVLGFQRAEEGGGWRNLGQWLGDEWRPARVEGSDCKALSQVGRAHEEGGVEKWCWLKQGDLTFQAVRLALMMKDHRVADVPPKQDGARIEAVRFEGGLMGGQTLHLNRDMNNLIGIRGSGKSSILECIRYALDHRLRAEADDSDYKEALVARTLGSGGRIILELTTGEGHAYRVERILGDSPKVYRDRELVPGLRPEGVFKSRYFGQKDLAKFSEQRFARELVERFTTSGRTASVKAETLVHQIEQKLVRMAQAAERLSVAADVEAKVAELKELLRKFDDGVREKLSTQVALEKEVALARDLVTHGQDAVTALQRWIEDYGSAAERLARLPAASEDPKVRAVRSAFEQFRAGYDRVREALRFLEPGLAAIDLARAELIEFQEASKEAFAEVRRSLQLPGDLNADTFVRLTKDRSLHEAKLSELNVLKQKNADARRSLEGDLAALQLEWQAGFRSMESEVRRLNADSPGLSIRLEFKGDKVAFTDHLVGLVSGLQRKTIEKIAATFADGVELYRDLLGQGSRLKDQAGLREEQLAKLRESLGDRLNELLSWRVPDAVEIEYLGKPLHDHSLGQRATALMLFLLTRREFDALIVDQPEDDLDNQTLFTEVIRRLLDLKGHRQLLFATHSPNIPVLGDAEQVVRCQYTPDSIAVLSGSIDCPSIQHEIVAVMEGGEEALRRRNQIYSVWTR
jgi:chromosome segregation protein